MADRMATKAFVKCAKGIETESLAFAWASLPKNLRLFGRALSSLWGSNGSLWLGMMLPIGK